jgi:hypothetical protein
VAKRKWTNTVSNDKKVNKTTVMPVVAIRDPYSWMQVREAMCANLIFKEEKNTNESVVLRSFL